MFCCRNNAQRLDEFMENYRALRPTRFTYSDLKRITHGFKLELRNGRHGMMYKGMLSTDIPVIVKFYDTIKNTDKVFIDEVERIGRVHHENIVRFIGYCADEQRCALVYEFMENGSIEKYISSGSRTLGWEKLLDIALGIAKGIDYLQQSGNRRDLPLIINSRRILLDGNLKPKLSDFGLPDLTQMAGFCVTRAHMAPVGIEGSHKTDVYIYGMTLLDMVRRWKDLRTSVQDVGDEHFFEWIRTMYKQLKGEDLDVRIEKKNDVNIIRRLISVGNWCIQPHPKDRPYTSVVIRMLETQYMPDMPPKPTFCKYL